MESQIPSYNFILLAGAWCRDQSAILLTFVWRAYDKMQIENPPLNREDLERNITQLLEHRVHSAMSGYEPFYVQHGPYERETMKAPPAQPPQYDLAFILKSDEQIMWPMEAKILETAATVADYIRDIRNEFLKCRYAPFSSEGAMLGYLLSGSPTDAFQRIAAKTPCALKDHPSFSGRPHKLSQHVRSVPIGKPYPSTFRCHHLMLEFLGQKRSARGDSQHRAKRRGQPRLR
jgi:hypothetical protein